MLDARTLLYVITAAAMLSAVAIHLLYRFQAPVLGPSWWSGGAILLAAGALSMALRGVLPLVPSVIAGNLLADWGYLFTLNGMALFLGRRPVLGLRTLPAWGGLTLAFGFFLYWFSAVEPSLNTRLIGISIVLGSMSAAFLWVMRPLCRGGAGLLFFKFWMLFYLALNGWRLAVCLLSPDDNQVLFTGMENAYYLAGIILVCLGMSLSLVLVLSEELNDRVTRQNQVLQENIRLRDEVEAIRQHDLKSPIVPIVSLSELVLAQNDLSEESRLYVGEMQRAANDALENINRFLDISGLEGGRYRLRLGQVDLERLVREVANPLWGADWRNGSRMCVTRHDNAAACEGDCLVCGDEGMLRTMLGNLMKNAYEASLGEGRVEVDLYRGKSGVDLVITNDGEVPLNLRSRFFEKYTTGGKTTGTGLGTYSALLIARAHGGSISLNCSIAGRTRLTVSLPRACPASAFLG